MGSGRQHPPQLTHTTTCFLEKQARDRRRAYAGGLAAPPSRTLLSRARRPRRRRQSISIHESNADFLQTAGLQVPKKVVATGALLFGPRSLDGRRSVAAPSRAAGIHQENRSSVAIFLLTRVSMLPPTKTLASTHPAAMPAPERTPELMADLLQEVFLLLPPDEPETLVRAAAVSKTWRGLISSCAFLRRYREFHHQEPPLLGFLTRVTDAHSPKASFVPCTAFLPPDLDLRGCNVLDCCHGRALLYDSNSFEFIHWDPMTGEKKHFPNPGIHFSHFNAAVLCANMVDCDHSDCAGGPFLVAFVGTNSTDESDDESILDVIAQGYIYSSETGAWSVSSSLDHDYYLDIPRPPVVAGTTVYFICPKDDSILRYELGGDRKLSLIPQPREYDNGSALIPADGGGMWFVGFDVLELTLYHWPGTEVSSWELHGALSINKLSVDGHFFYEPYLIGSAKGPDSDVVFLSVDDGIFMINLKSESGEKVAERGEFDAIFPYTSFCTPVRRRGVTAGGQGAMAATDLSSVDLDGATPLSLEVP